MMKRTDLRESPGSLRPSQLITTFGPGSIVQMEKDSVIIMGLDFWPDDESDYKILNHPFLEAILRKEHFRMPISVGRNRIIPTKSFPIWGICSNSKCKRLQRHKIAPPVNKREFRCEECGAELYHARFITMCDKGHIDEFPWVEWAHSRQKEGEKCTALNPKLRFRALGQGPGLADYYVKCDDCGASRSCGSATAHNGLENIVTACSGYSPWLGDKAEDCKDERGVPLKVRGVQTRATLLYYPSTVSALYIPKWLHEIQKTITKEKTTIEHLRNASPPMPFKQIAESMPFFQNLRTKYSVDDIVKHLEKRFSVNQYMRETSTELEIRQQEYEDLIDANFKDDEFLEIEDVKVDSELAQYIGRLKKIKRITEIRVLRYFTRGNAPDPYSPEDYENVSICKISRRKLDWYPAVENRGEGILFTLNEELLKKWESIETVRKRCDAIVEGFEGWARQRDWNPTEQFGPRYILLHTLAHILIREIANWAGYNEASIRERIYRGQNYNGILLYTASPSSEGSLGGLVRHGDLANFERLLHSGIDRAKRCSRDPLCLEDDPIEKKKSNVPYHARINGSACYACTLLPETSCENSNRLLDRKLLFDEQIGFFKL